MYYLKVCGLASSWLLVNKDRGSHEEAEAQGAEDKPANLKERSKEREKETKKKI